MHATIAIAAFAALAAAQGVRQDIAPGGGPPPGCSSNYDGSFTIAPVNVTSSSKRDLTERQNSPLSIMLQNGILTDSEGRTGYIAANQQFQFDKPPQAGAIYTAGWSVCQNGTLALGTDAVFYRCLSGGFYNLYFESRGGQCIESLLLTRPLNEAGAPGPVSGPAAPSSTPMMASTMSSMPAMSSPMSMSSMMTSSMMSSMPTSYAPPMTGGAMGTTAMSAPSAAAPSSVVPATNGAATMGPELFGLAAGILALAAL